jgi:hypothetical protein
VEAVIWIHHAVSQQESGTVLVMIIVSQVSMASLYVKVQSKTVVVCVQGQGVAVVVIIAAHVSLCCTRAPVVFAMIWI